MPKPCNTLASELIGDSLFAHNAFGNSNCGVLCGLQTGVLGIRRINLINVRQRLGLVLSQQWSIK
jgi:hypothetical protein